MLGLAMAAVGLLLTLRAGAVLEFSQDVQASDRMQRLSRLGGERGSRFGTWVLRIFGVVFLAVGVLAVVVSVVRLASG